MDYQWNQRTGILSLYINLVASTSCSLSDISFENPLKASEFKGDE
jgi:hypothetical protein